MMPGQTKDPEKIPAATPVVVHPAKWSPWRGEVQPHPRVGTSGTGYALVRCLDPQESGLTRGSLYHVNERFITPE